MEKETPQKSKRKWLKVLFIVLLACVIICAAPYYVPPMITFWWNFTAPHTTYIESPPSQILQQFSTNIFILSWQEDDSQVKVRVSGISESDPDIITNIAIKTGEILHQENELPQPQLQEKETLGIDQNSEIWAICSEKELVAAAGGFEEKQFWIKIYQNQNLLQTFDFTSDQWIDSIFTPSRNLAFSPQCNFLTLRLSGNIIIEGNAREELWLVDITKETLENIIIGKKEAGIIWEYSVQPVSPSWSPDENEFVYGGWDFGLEIYNLAKDSSRRLTGPEVYLHAPEWSPSGKWIAGIQYGYGTEYKDRIYIFSPDGSLHSYTEECDLIFDFVWAAQEDKLVYTCDSSDDYNLMIWDLEDW